MASNYIFQENCMFLSVSRVSLLYVFLCITISMCVVNGYLSNTHCLTMSAPWAKAPKKHLWGRELSKRLISTWVRVQQVQKSGLWFERLRRLFVLLINTVVVEFCFHVLSLLLPAKKIPLMIPRLWLQQLWILIAAFFFFNVATCLFSRSVESELNTVAHLGTAGITVRLC